MAPEAQRDEEICPGQWSSQQQNTGLKSLPMSYFLVCSCSFRQAGQCRTTLNSRNNEALIHSSGNSRLPEEGKKENYIRCFSSLAHDMYMTDHIIKASYESHMAMENATWPPFLASWPLSCHVSRMILLRCLLPSALQIGGDHQAVSSPRIFCQNRD